MKHRTREQLSNIPPENRKTVEEKLIDRGIEFTRIPLAKRGKRMGVFCPDLFDTFVLKQYCRACPRWAGGTGRFYLCKKK